MKYSPSVSLQAGIFCPLDSAYDGDATTKQNILCARRSVREVMEQSGELRQRRQPKTKKKNAEEEADNDLAFEEVEGDDDNIAFRPPAFSYSLPRPKLFVLVLDRSFEQQQQQQQQQHGWEMLQMSLFGFISRLPAGSSLAVVTYGSGEEGGEGEDGGAEVALPPTLVTDSNAEGLHGRIPRRPSRSKTTHSGRAARKTAKAGGESRGCLDCALKLAYRIMNISSSSSSSSADGRIVVATGADSDLQQVSSETASLAEENRLPVYAVLLPQPFAAVTSTSSEKSGETSTFSHLTRFGAVYSAAASGPGRRGYLSGLSRAFDAVASSTTDSGHVSFHREVRAAEEGEEDFLLQQQQEELSFSGNFVVEEHLRRDLWAAATVEDERDVESFEVLSPTGKRHSLPSYDHGMAYFDLRGINEPGIWSYNIALYPSSSPFGNSVNFEVLGRADDVNKEGEEDDSAVILKLWVEQRIVGGRPEVILYASVTQGDSLPVLDADVVAEVRRPGRPADELPVSLRLRDSGSGYPDVTSGDGVYSAYFTGFSAESGRYSVSVRASHGDGAARTPKMGGTVLNGGDTSGSVCCGSSAPCSFTIPTGPFLRFAEAPSFYVEQPVDNFYLRQQQQQQQQQQGLPKNSPPLGLVNDVFPPSRVTDFRVENYVPDSLFVTLSWTAPGGDLDSGRAFRYEIRCYTNRAALRDDAFAEMSIPVHASLVPSPEEAGNEQRCTVGVPWPNEVFYYAVVAFDEAGNRGEISNTAAVFIREDPDDGEGAFEDEENGVESSSDSQPLHTFNYDHVGSGRYVAYAVVSVVSLALVLLSILSAVAIRRFYRASASSNAGLVVVASDSEKGEGSSASTEDEDCDSSTNSSEHGGSLAGTLKKIMRHRQQQQQQQQHRGAIVSSDMLGGSKSVWTTAASSGGSSPTSDYGSGSGHKSPVVASTTMPLPPSHLYRAGMQKATSQELPGVHRVVMTAPYGGRLHSPEKQVRSHHLQQQQQQQQPDCESRAATLSTDCSVYSHVAAAAIEVPDSPSASSSMSGPAPRISVLEDFSVYRDLSNLGSSGDYLSFTQLPGGGGTGSDVTLPMTPPPQSSSASYFDTSQATMRSTKSRHESLV